MRMDEFLRKNTETLKIRIDTLFTVIILCVCGRKFVHSRLRKYGICMCCFAAFLLTVENEVALNFDVHSLLFVAQT